MGGKTHAAFSLRVRKAMQDAGRAVKSRGAPTSAQTRGTRIVQNGGGSITRRESGVSQMRAARAVRDPLAGDAGQASDETASSADNSSRANTPARITQSPRKMRAAWRHFYLRQAEALAAELAKEAPDE